ncbi:hypothetical protein HYH03_018439 [Edaphochlamys debaryana]|uniref:Sulfatase N-terminal domain-containing protein n=1 Tax=Edaphochlamys debaryana TaxID=47281 RepID=A0A835XHX7_9CHLO|nr:hypothetical protein HYH03_018439 [Edaphochlamys debaryana]|eukprot:KAG2482631.1 hypothetical protein HYH03_018439 [Edaphochlamys debaryana]
MRASLRDLAGLVALCAAAACSIAQRVKPNFVIVVTDDQDDVYNSTHPYYMPALDRQLRKRGVHLNNFIVNTAVCCPARVSLLTGKLAHCHNVTNNYYDKYQSGSFKKWFQTGQDRDWLPGRMSAAGYDVYYVGKFFNEYQWDYPYYRDGRRYMPPGMRVFDSVDPLEDADLPDACLSTNTVNRTCSKGKHMTDAVRDKALQYISTSAAEKRPFWIQVMPLAPHAVQCRTRPGWCPPTPPLRHANLYANDNVSIPRTPNWYARNTNLPRPTTGLTEAAYAANLNALQLGRLRSLRAVDEMIDRIVERLTDLALLNNTYIVFTSDNGFHLGAFGLLEGKVLPIEEDVRVPFFIRGPGIPEGVVSPFPAALIDLPATILAAAGLPLPDYMDGLPLPLNPALASIHTALLRNASLAVPEQLAALRAEAAAAQDLAASPAPPPAPLPVPPAALPEIPSTARRDSLILEGWSGSASRPDDSASLAHFKALRLCTPLRLFRDGGGANPTNRLGALPAYAARQVPAPGLYCYKYVAWCRGARELYDLSADPYETRSRLTLLPPRVVDRLDALLSALVHCRGPTCRNPYALLHPGGGVWNFSAALSPEHDPLYASLPKLRFVRCRSIYVRTNEQTWAQGFPQPPSPPPRPWLPPAPPDFPSSSESAGPPAGATPPPKPLGQPRPPSPGPPKPRTPLVPHPHRLPTRSW